MATKAQHIEFLLSQIRDSVGSLAGGEIYFYSAGTTTPKTIWLDRDKVSEAANPYTLDVNGTAQLYADGLYKIVIKNAAGSTIYTRDNLNFYDNAVIDDIGVLLTTWGDIVFRGTAGLERLPAGTLGYGLSTQGAGADPVWANLATALNNGYINGLRLSNNVADALNDFDIAVGIASDSTNTH